MRVPWWIKNIAPEKMVTIQRRVNRVTLNPLDNPEGLEKTPPHYQKRYMENRTRTPLPVHYRPVEVPYEYNPEEGIIERIEDTAPILPMFPPESHYGLWGGEGMVKGFSWDRKKLYTKRHPRWWFPKLSQVTLYSEILDKYYLTIVTKRTLTLIDEATGFDYYILKTHDVDLQSRLGARLKGNMLRTLATKSLYPDDPEKRDKVLEKYKEFVIPAAEAEWVGLTLAEAERKYNVAQWALPVPLKEVFREQLLLELNKLRAEGKNVDETWMSRFNPFAKKSPETA